MYQNPSAFLSKNCNDQEVELRDLDEGEDDDVIHVDDLEKAREKAAKEAKAAFDAEESEK